MVATLTVRDIAERIRRPGENIEGVVDRLRNWTKEGLLHAVGDKNPGTGRPRRYTEWVIIDALVLSALTELGIPAVKAARIRGEEKSLLQLARIGADKVEEHANAGGLIFLSITLTFDHAHEAAARAAGHPLPANVTLHFTEKGKAVEHITIPHWTEASIVLNLTTLFKRICNPVEK